MSAPRVRPEGIEGPELRHSADGRRLILLDPKCGVAAELASVDEMFAITVVWSDEPGSPFLVWLSTIDHRAVALDSDALESCALAEWLALLPGWEAAPMEAARTQRGLHLVWRRPDG